MPSPWKRFSWKSAMGMSCWVARPASKRTDPRAAPTARGFFTRSDGLRKTRQWRLPLPEVVCARFHSERGYGALTRARSENGAGPDLAQSLGYFFQLEVLPPRDPVLSCGLCGVEHGHGKNFRISPNPPSLFAQFCQPVDHPQNILLTHIGDETPHSRAHQARGLESEKDLAVPVICLQVIRDSLTYLVFQPGNFHLRGKARIVELVKDFFHDGFEDILFVAEIFIECSVPHPGEVGNFFHPRCLQTAPHQNLACCEEHLAARAMAPILNRFVAGTAQPHFFHGGVC